MTSVIPVHSALRAIWLAYRASKPAQDLERDLGGPQRRLVPLLVLLHQARG